MQYKRQIDGLRAIAVLAVILSHAGIRYFGGGYVGVDVFFVISGYLITDKIVSERSAGTFSIWHFYERRARRILPALFFVIAACVPFAWIWLLPVDMKDFSQSVAAAASFSSNIFFSRTGSYFDQAAELRPMLHTWSLAVEEQYYLIFPVVIGIIWQLGEKARSIIITTIAIASLAAALRGAIETPSESFYLLQTRAWELLLGSLIVFYGLHDRFASTCNVVAETASFFGLLLIGYSIVALDSRISPSLYTLVPTSGAALVIVFGNQNTSVGKLLGMKLLVDIGLFSYSAYLWHQPVFAFARYRASGHPSEAEMLMLSIASLLLGYLSWRYIEVRFRKQGKTTRNKTGLLFLTGSIALFSFGVLGHHTNGFAGRTMNDRLPKSYEAYSLNYPGEITGVDGNLCVSELSSLCRVNIGNSSRKLLLVGDSHSADYTAQFRKYVRDNAIDGWQMSVGGCAFIPFHFERHGNECGRARAVIEKAVKEKRFDQIIVVVSLASAVSQIEDTAAANVDENIDSFASLLSSMLSDGADVYYFVPRPYFNISPPKAAISHSLNDLRIIRRPIHERLHTKISSLQKNPHFHLFDQAATLIDAGCGNEACFNGHTSYMLPLYRDENHLTHLGANTAFDMFTPLLREK